MLVTEFRVIYHLFMISFSSSFSFSFLYIFLITSVNIVLIKMKVNDDSSSNISTIAHATDGSVRLMGYLIFYSMKLWHIHIQVIVFFSLPLKSF